MDTAVFHQITKGTFAIALVFIAAAFAFAGKHWALAVSVGASVVLLNWFSIRWIASKITQSQSLKRSVAFLLLGIKMLLMISVSWILLDKFDLQPIGFGIGMSALVLGVIVGTGMAPRSEKSDENMESSNPSITQPFGSQSQVQMLETQATEPTNLAVSKKVEVRARPQRVTQMYEEGTSRSERGRKPKINLLRKRYETQKEKN